jgi:phosphoribosylformimino-5-aminoimidazole carboxamide ribotide isomerase
MDIFPAIDIKDGRAVRLLRGDYAQMTVYSDSPAAVAQSFFEQGARCLHVVDLDGAKDGSAANFALVRDVAAAFPGGFIEVGGGIRDEERIEAYLSLGVSRVILGTAAVEDFSFLARMAEKYPQKIAVGVDAKNGAVATHGWLTVTSVSAFDFCLRCRDAGVSTVIYTDIDKDGAMAGPNLPAYRALSRITGLAVIASGGVSSAEDILSLRRAGAAGAIVGKALYTGALDLGRIIRLAHAD